MRERAFFAITRWLSTTEALPETKVTVVGLKLYTKRMTERDKYPELNLKILRTKRELIKQLVDNKIWNEDDIYAYLDV